MFAYESICCYAPPMAQLMFATSFARRPLDVILSSGGAIRVLRALLAHGGQLPATRLAVDAQMTPVGTRKVLHELVRTGIVDQTGSGRAVLYQAAASHPLVSGFEQLFTAESRRYTSMIEAVRTAAAAREILAAWLFGSVAQHTDGPSSDFDVAIVIAGDVDHLADRLRGEVRNTSDRSGFRISITAMSPDDVVSHFDEKSAFWAGLENSVVLKGDSPNELARKRKAQK